MVMLKLKNFLSLMPYSLGFMILVLKILFSTKIIVFWMILELKLFLYMMILIKDQKLILNQEKKMKMYSPLILYFMFQSLGSMVFLMGLSFHYKTLIILLSILIKMGLYPFFWWVMNLGIKISMVSLWLLLVVKKVGLMYMLIWFMNYSKLLMIILYLKMFFGLMGIKNSLNNLKLMILYSSFFDTMFMMLLSFFDTKNSILYFMMYSLLLALVLMLNFLLKEGNKSFSKIKEKYFFYFMLLNLIGIPPLIGFYYKLMFLMSIFKSYKIPIMCMVFSFLFMIGVIFQALSYFFFFLNHFSSSLQMKLFNSGNLLMMVMVLLKFQIYYNF